MSRRLLITLSFLAFFKAGLLPAQSVPASEENIPFLVTFGSGSASAWGDDDFTQVFFFVIPEEQKKPFFIRIYDPETGGANDEINGAADTKVKFSVFGGKGTISDPDASSADPVGNFKSGIEITSRTFDNNSSYDNKWYSLGPFNPAEGELKPEYNGYIFKVIAEGLSGDDGNLYKYFLSSSSSDNIEVEGANAFTYEYTFRLWDSAGSVCHIYPYINNKVISIKIHTFDFDNDGEVRIVSYAKKSEKVSVSSDNQWKISTHPITEKEKNTSLDVQLIKLRQVNSNNVVFYITNQYGELLPFFTSPIGGVPKYPYEIKHKAYNGSN